MEDFLTRSIFVGIGIAVSTSLLGVFILWKKMAYFGDSVSHSSILGLGIAALFSFHPIVGVLIFALVFSLLITLLGKMRLYSKDTAIGISSYVSLALGLILIAAFPDQVNLNSYLLGDILSTSKQEVILIYLNSLLVVLMMIFYFKKLLLATISEDLALIQKIKVNRLNLLFLLLVAITIVFAIKVTGIFLVTAMLIMPAAIARNLSNNPIQMLLTALTISVTSVITGTLVSIYLNYPVSPTIIFVMILIFFWVLIQKKVCNYPVFS